MKNFALIGASGYIAPRHLKAIKDTLYSVYYQSGCNGWEMEIGEYLVQNVLMIDDRIEPFSHKLITDFGFSEFEKQKILTEFQNRKK